MLARIALVTAMVTLIAGSAVAAEAGRVPLPVAKPKTQSATAKPDLATAKPLPVPARPTPDRIVFEDLGKHYCIGNRLCTEHCARPEHGCQVKTVYTQKLDQPTRISRIQLYAHNNIGPTRRPDLLLVKVDGAEFGRFPVNRAGSTISVVVNRNGQLITIEAMYNRNGSLLGGEQSVIAEGAVISDIYAFGRDAR